MAIYHMEAKIISRGEGRSAVAAAAYISCNKIYNDYDGIQHDYSCCCRGNGEYASKGHYFLLSA